MATVRNLACIAFRPEALDVHDLVHSGLYGQNILDKYLTISQNGLHGPINF